MVRHWEQGSARETFQQTATTYMTAIKLTVEHHLHMVGAAHLFLKQHPDFSTASFKTVASQILHHHHGAQLIQWQPSNDRNSTIELSSADISAAMLTTLRHYATTATPDQHTLAANLSQPLTAKDDTAAVLILSAPVLTDKNVLLGTLVNVLDNRDLLDSALQKLFKIPSGIDLYFFDETDPAQPLLLHYHTSRQRTQPVAQLEKASLLHQLHATESFPMVKRKWRIYCLPVDLGSFSAYHGIGSAVVLVVGLLSTLFLILFFRHHTQQTEKLRQLAEERATALAETENHRLELELSELRFRSIAQSALDAIISANRQGKITYWNRGAEIMFGYSMQEIVNHSLTKIIPDQFREAHNRGLERVNQTGQTKVVGQTVELSGLRKSGQEFPMELSLSTWLVKEERFFSAVIRDITERKHAQEKILREKERAEQYLSIAGTIILALDSQGCVTLINKRGQETLGYSQEELIGKDWFKTAIPAEIDTEVRGIFQEIMADHRDNLQQYENKVINRQGQRRLISWYNILLRDKTGHPVGTLSSGEDVTEKRILEEQSRRVYQSQAAISQLLHTVIKPIARQELAEEALQIILEIPWLAVKSMGAIFLTDESTGDLILVAHKGLSQHLLTHCTRITPGFCLCGRAAKLQETVFASHIDERHDILFEGIKPHGHYCVPILFQTKTLGVINLYIPDGHNKNLEEITLLTSIADTLAGVLERKRMEDQLKHIAHHDSLTGLPNRAMFLQHLTRFMATSHREKGSLAVMFLDLDRFKAVNDTMGHEMGDKLLIEVAKRLRECLREADIVARLGGDEFTIILTTILQPEDVSNVAKKIISKLSQPFPIHDHVCHIGASVGISLFPDHDSKPEKLLTKADLALYAVKNSGRNNFRFYQPDMDLDTNQVSC